MNFSDFSQYNNSNIFYQDDSYDLQSENDSHDTQSVISDDPVPNDRKLRSKYTYDCNVKSYLCKICDYYCKKQSTIAMHCSIKHGNQSLHECTECKSSFPTKSLLQQHHRVHHSKELLSCLHPSCTKRFKLRSSLVLHVMRNHFKKYHESLFLHDKDTFFKKQMVCNHCKKRFSNNAIYYHVGVCFPCSPFYRKKSKPVVKNR
jgi:hypothetical protein